MKTYNEYKDSGVLYLGKIPAHWTIMPLKRICRNEKYCIKTGPFGSQLKGEDLKPDGDVRVYNQRNVIDNQFEVVQSYVTKEKAKELSSFLTKSNDVLISSRGTIGKAALLPERCKMGILHPCLIALRINEKIFSTRNLIYMFNYSLTFKDYLYLESNATTIDVIYTETIKRLKLPVPPLTEQQAIADYLDNRCAELDTEIDDKKKQIKLLEELKQAVIQNTILHGIDKNVAQKHIDGEYWQGDIPAHWTHKRLKFCCEFRNGYTPSKQIKEFWTNGTIPWYRMEDIRESGRLLHEAKQYITEQAVKGGGLFEADSFILATTATIGEHARLIADSLANQQFTNLKIRKSRRNNLLADYFYYYLFFIDDLCKVYTHISTFPAVSMNDLNNFPVLLPPLAEQQAIADYLDTKTAEIDEQINLQNEQIHLLDELKQSIISQAVTGKICVTD